MNPIITDTHSFDPPETENARTSPFQNHNPKSKNPSTGHARRNGNIARLPKSVRDRINMMLQDGVTYPAILHSLGEQGRDICPSSLTHWKNGGYPCTHCSPRYAPGVALKRFAKRMVAVQSGCNVVEFRPLYGRA